MLTKITVQNLRSYREAKLPLAELGVLIGANAAGKSNFIEAMRLASWLSHGRRLGDLRHAIEKGELSIRGRPQDLAREASRPIVFGAQIDQGGQSFDFELGLRVHNGSGLRIEGETLRLSDTGGPRGAATAAPHYEIASPASEGSNDVQVAYNNFSRGGVKPRITCTDQQAIFTQLQTPARFKTKRSQQELPVVIGGVQRDLEQILFLDPVPAHMRGYAFPDDAPLQDDGSNLSGVLKTLADDEWLKEDILAFVKQLPEQDVADIDFLDGPRGEVMVRLIETFGDRKYSCEAALLSDGTLRVLSIAAALLAVPRGSLVVIEEIDNGVHPSRAGSLLERIRKVARERSLHVLLTTHNPALLDALPLDTVPDVVFCYRDPEEGDSRLVRLADIKEYSELVAQGPLGSLMTRRVLDRLVKTPRTAQERQQQVERTLSLFGEREP